MLVLMMMSMQSNSFRWHYQNKLYSSYYHLTPDKDGIIEHSLGLKQSQNGAQEASAPVNLTCPFQLVRPPWSNDECCEGVQGKEPDGEGEVDLFTAVLCALFFYTIDWLITKRLFTQF